MDTISSQQDTLTWITVQEVIILAPNSIYANCTKLVFVPTHKKSSLSTPLLKQKLKG